MPAAFTDLAQTCAPGIAVETIAAVVSVESNFQPFAVRINSGPLADQPATKAEAIEAAISLIAEGRDVQLGLGGIGFSELKKLSLTISDVFDPCLNLKATATLLGGYYRMAIRAGATSGRAEHVMLQSYYGRKDPAVGAMAEYDEQVQSEASRLSARLTTLTIGEDVPEPGADGEPPSAQPIADGDPVQPDDQVVSVPSWDVFKSRRRSSVLVFQNEQPEQSE
ncbi:lytic transglycosylase domain-containing protein [Ensifer sp. IC3342]|nr:lytic transglycosylase domain-containing protein [Ensifer sp. BRP08]MCA1451300.1 lytic transglycosylase domain-containing protein [Ensifer sp. IC3342]